MSVTANKKQMVVKCRDKGMSVGETCKLLCISITTYYNYLKSSNVSIDSENRLPIKSLAKVIELPFEKPVEDDIDDFTSFQNKPEEISLKKKHIPIIRKKSKKKLDNIKVNYNDEFIEFAKKIEDSIQ